MQKIQLYIEGQRVDLFDDESVVLTQTIQNVKDVQKVFNYWLCQTHPYCNCVRVCLQRVSACAYIRMYVYISAEMFAEVSCNTMPQSIIYS